MLRSPFRLGPLSSVRVRASDAELIAAPEGIAHVPILHADMLVDCVHKVTSDPVFTCSDACPRSTKHQMDTPRGQPNASFNSLYHDWISRLADLASFHMALLHFHNGAST